MDRSLHGAYKDLGKAEIHRRNMWRLSDELLSHLGSTFNPRIKRNTRLYLTKFRQQDFQSYAIRERPHTWNDQRHTGIYCLYSNSSAYIHQVLHLV